MNDAGLLAKCHSGHAARLPGFAIPTCLRAFVQRHDSSASICLVPVAVKPEALDDSILDISSPPHLSRAAATVRTRQVVGNDLVITEILSSDDDMEVEASLRRCGASSDPPDSSADRGPLETLDSDDEPEASAIETLSTTNKVQRVEYLHNAPSYFPVFRQPTAIIIDLRDSKFDFYNKDGELKQADAVILDKNQESWANTGMDSQSQKTEKQEGE
ncbi:hypothetical protein B0H13DRAFT_2371916 [Mycena leptocephala]|nr:hypothetical protein B0H13DRAFT_2371916 [Mycena leptocephala]